MENKKNANSLINTEICNQKYKECFKNVKIDTYVYIQLVLTIS